MRKHTSIITAFIAIGLLSIFIYACTKTDESGALNQPANTSTNHQPKDRSTMSGTTYTLLYTIGYANGDSLKISGDDNDSTKYIANFVGGSNYNVTASISSNDIKVFSGTTLLTEHNLAPNGWPGDCAKVGERGETESYEDCYKRNWTNFCCDFTSCFLQATQPVGVAIGIALGCLEPGRAIIIIYNEKTHQPIYNN